MKNSYIANSTEAAALHSGKQTAIIVPMKVQPKPSDVTKVGGTDKYTIWKDDDVTQVVAPYAIGQPVYVREGWMNVFYATSKRLLPIAKTGSRFENLEGSEWQSPATMPKEAARTWFVPTSVEAVRVQDITEEQAFYLNIRAITKDNITCKYGLCDSDGFPGGIGWEWRDFSKTLTDALAKYFINKLGQQAWDNNHFVWLYKIEKHAPNQ